MWQQVHVSLHNSKWNWNEALLLLNAPESQDVYETHIYIENELDLWNQEWQIL